MTRLAGLMTAGLVLLAGFTPSWSGPPNPTTSDVNDNTAGGTGAVQNVTTGARNTGFGTDALFSTSTGSDNTAIGSAALGANTTGGENTAIGVGALQFNSAGSANTAVGVGALQFNSSGTGNTAIGADALSDTSGSGNTAVGEATLPGNTTGQFNTALGAGALGSSVTGSKNTALGYLALSQSTGQKNIAVGVKAGSALTSGDRNIYIGHLGAASESLTMRLGEAQTQTFVAGVTTAAVNGTPVLIDPSGQLGIPLSSARYKREIAPLGAHSAGVFQLRPVTFVYTHDRQGLRQYGLIAEEVAAVYPELVTRTATGEVQAVRYQELIPLLLNELQRQQQELAALRMLVGPLHGQAAVCESDGAARGRRHVPADVRR